MSETNFVRHKRTKALLNIDNSAYEKYKLDRNAIYRMNGIVDEVDKLKHDMSDIKVMLAQIISNTSGKE
jgi:hypothetical protein